MDKKIQNKFKRAILSTRLAEGELKAAVKKETDKQLEKELPFKVRIQRKIKKFFAILYIVLVTLQIYNYIIYGLAIMFILTLIGVNVSTLSFIIGVSIFLIYDLITNDWSNNK